MSNSDDCNIAAAIKKIALDGTLPFILMTGFLVLFPSLSACDSGTIVLCENEDCSQHGVCLVFKGSPRCECDTAYVEAPGLRCVEEASSPCAEVTCQANASCKVQDDAGVCVCDAGFRPDGDDCVQDADPCDVVDCGPHGGCLPVGGLPTCACDAGFHPDGLSCTEDGPCEGVDCGPHGDCVPSGKSPACQCDEGFRPDGLTCLEDDPCEGIDCGLHGDCVPASGMPSCQCDVGFHPDGLTCTEDDPCEGVSCGTNAHCSAGTCQCDDGYQGDPQTLCEEYNSEEERIRQELVDIAMAEVGMCEGVVDRPYMDYQPGLWCYDFVAWVYTQANEGLTQPYYLPKRYTNDLPPGWRPKPGDLVKYTYQHFGMVKGLSQDGTVVYTIEGNVNSCVTTRSTTDASVEYYGTLEGQF